ncbi:MAG: serine hydrolase domain-containing protein [Pyrinomonadaceae bacterium]
MHERISAYLSERIAANDFPSAVYLVAEKGRIVFRDALGHSVVEPEKIEARPDTIYDLASLTKPLVTGLLAARQIEEGEIELGSHIGDVGVVFGDSRAASLTVQELAAHTSGLPAWVPFYLLAESPSPTHVSEVIAAQPLGPLGSRVEYSDLNFIALSLAIEGPRPDFEFDLAVAKELGLERTAFDPLEKGFERGEIAACEKGNAYERQACVEQGYLQPSAAASGADRSSVFREYQIWGEVHDGNAWFMGGAAGHAGLFSTAEDVFKIALQFLPNYTQLLKPETCELFRTNFTKGLNEDRSFAFQLASTRDATAGTQMPPESFGHNGFTGTSLWIDPVNDRVFILLTNRTHNHPLPFTNINSVRRRFHDLAIDVLKGSK